MFTAYVTLLVAYNYVQLLTVFSETYFWCWINAEFKLWLFSKLHRKSFHQQGSETWPGATTKAVENKEALKSRTLVSKFSDTIDGQVHNFFPNSVVSTSVIVGRIFFSGYQLLWME